MTPDRSVTSIASGAASRILCGGIVRRAGRESVLGLCCAAFFPGIRSPAAQLSLHGIGPLLRFWSDGGDTNHTSNFNGVTGPSHRSLRPELDEPRSRPGAVSLA